MTEDFYVIAIAALLPLTACMLVFQVNPYHALVIRGILGAVAALVYALFGAADVALTEALVGTMLSITLYAVAVRSSMNMRVGVLETESSEIVPSPPLAITGTSDQTSPAKELLSALRQAFDKYHLRLEWVIYPSLQALQTALRAKEVHTICILSNPEFGGAPPSSPAQGQPYHLQTRVQRLYEVMQTEGLPSLARLTYVNPGSLSDLSQSDANPSEPGMSSPLEGQP